MKLISLTIIISYFTLITGFAQEQKDYINQIKAGLYPSPPEKVIKSHNRSKKVLVELTDFAKQNNPETKKAALDAITRVGLLNPSHSIRSQAVLILSQWCPSTDFELSEMVVQGLKQFTYKDFSRESIENIEKSNLKHLEYFNPDFVELVGLLMLSNFKDKIKNQLASNNHLNEKTKLLGYATLARLKDQESMKIVEGAYKAMPMIEETILQLVPLFVYSRHPVVIRDMIVEALELNKDCEGANTITDQKTPCGYLLLSQIAPYINDFPIAVEPGGDLAIENWNEGRNIINTWISTKEILSFRNDIL
jgi:hypothetical protein